MRAFAAAVAVTTVMLITGCVGSQTSAEPTASKTSKPSATATPTSTSTPAPTLTPDSVPQDPEQAFLDTLSTWPTLAEPVANNPREVFIEWGQYQCEQLREGGRYGMLGSVVSWGFTGGDMQSLAEGLMDELFVTETAATYLCPDLKPEFDEFLVLLEATLKSEE